MANIKMPKAMFSQMSVILFRDGYVWGWGMSIWGGVSILGYVQMEKPQGGGVDILGGVGTNPLRPGT